MRERGDEAVERVRELTDGIGAHSVLECVGLEQAIEHRARRSPVPAARSAASACPSTTRRRPRVAFWKNVIDRRRPRPARAYIEELLPTCSRAGSSPAASSTAPARLEDVPDGYRAMNDREVLKFQIKP